MTWVYRVDVDHPDAWQIGYFTPSGKWFCDDVLFDHGKAVALVSYLNGGSIPEGFGDDSWWTPI